MDFAGSFTVSYLALNLIFSIPLTIEDKEEHQGPITLILVIPILLATIPALLSMALEASRVPIAFIWALCFTSSIMMCLKFTADFIFQKKNVWRLCITVINVVFFYSFLP
jgi:hypothetical protein